MKIEKTILFDGTSTDGWTNKDGTPIDWQIDEEGALVVGNHDIISKETYGDAHIHVEFWLPNMPEAEGQGKANSGVYVHGEYEIQVLDSFGVEYIHDFDCAGIYEQHVPITNANLPPETWQTYDIYFLAPKFNVDGEITQNGRLTLIFNGVCVHNNVELFHRTPGGNVRKRVAKGPLLLQDHGNKVRYRNIWIERLS